MRKPAVLILVLALTALGIAACGSDDSTTESTTAATTEETTSSAATGGSSAVAVEADPDGALAYTSGDLEADAGTVEIDFDNPASTRPRRPHRELGRRGPRRHRRDHREHDDGRRRPDAGHLHLLLLSRQPPGSRHGRHADRQVAGGGSVGRGHKTAD